MYEELQKRYVASSPIINLFQRLNVNVVGRNVSVFQGTMTGDDYSSIEKR